MATTSVLLYNAGTIEDIVKIIFTYVQHSFAVSRVSKLWNACSVNLPTFSISTVDLITHHVTHKTTAYLPSRRWLDTYNDEQLRDLADTITSHSGVLSPSAAMLVELYGSGKTLERIIRSGIKYVTREVNNYGFQTHRAYVTPDGYGEVAAISGRMDVIRHLIRVGLGGRLHPACAIWTGYYNEGKLTNELVIKDGRMKIMKELVSVGGKAKPNLGFTDFNAPESANTINYAKPVEYLPSIMSQSFGCADDCGKYDLNENIRAAIDVLTNRTFKPDMTPMIDIMSETRRSEANTAEEFGGAHRISRLALIMRQTILAGQKTINTCRCDLCVSQNELMPQLTRNEFRLEQMLENLIEEKVASLADFVVNISTGMTSVHSPNDVYMWIINEAKKKRLIWDLCAAVIAKVPIIQFKSIMDSANVQVPVNAFLWQKTFIESYLPYPMNATHFSSRMSNMWRYVEIADRDVVTLIHILQKHTVGELIHFYKLRFTAKISVYIIKNYVENCHKYLDADDAFDLLEKFVQLVIPGSKKFRVALHNVKYINCLKLACKTFNYDCSTIIAQMIKSNSVEHGSTKSTDHEIIIELCDAAETETIWISKTTLMEADNIIGAEHTAWAFR